MPGESGRPSGEALSATAVTTAPIRSERRRAVLTLVGGEDVGRVVPLEDAVAVTFGRAEECTVRLADANLSRVHARVIRLGEVFLLKDLGSTNGSWVNDKRVDFATELEDNCRIRLGAGTVMRFSLVDEAEERALVRLYEGTRRENVLEALRRLEERDETVTEDLEQAREFQRRALPEPPRLDGVDVDVVYRPLDRVGGDLYHVAATGERALRVFLADATGHGVKASLTTMLILSEYELVRRAASPARVLGDLNERLARTYAHLGVRFTAICLDFDLDAGVLRYSSAAHPAALLVRGGSALELECGGTFVGLVPGESYPEWETALSVGDAVLAVTDGVTEASAKNGEAFDRHLGEAAVRAVAGTAPVAQAVDAALSAYAGARALEDDVTMVSVSWRT